MIPSVAKGALRACGWQARGDKPSPTRYVLIGAPHTSNWDLPVMVVVTSLFGVRVSWIGKDSLFTPPLGWAMRALGGMPVDRSRRDNVVAQMCRVFDESESFVLAISPEGTRKHVPYWKSGFYHIARMANVPIVMGYADYRARQAGFGPELHPTGDIRRDMDQIRSFYGDKIGLHPTRAGAVRLREED